jgi:hypothetical protein
VKKGAVFHEACTPTAQIPKEPEISQKRAMHEPVIPLLTSFGRLLHKRKKQA